ncbi:MAG TPA: glycosyltransferase family A protein, partial [Planctomycetota bacterium]|nr:glycosyltransferase family A protein [Planctomycetota bacterium]
MSFEDVLVAAGWGFAALWALHSIAVLRGLPAFRWQGAKIEPAPGTEDQDPAGTPSISAILPCRDEAEQVERSVRSLLSQSLPGLEVIIVDDRSTDGSSDILTRLAASDPRARIVRIEKLPDGWLGKCHALWVGASHARGEWLLFSDADVVHREPSLLARALDHARRHDLDL